MKPKLYQYAACPYCNKVAAMLAYKRVDYDVIEVNPLNKKEIAFSESYRKVPIYIDGKGEQINDSNAILKHIDQEYPTPAVFSGDAHKKARDEKWIAWSEKFAKGLPTVIYNKFSDSLKAFDYITKTGKFNWFQSRSIKYSGAMIMTLVAKKIRKREEITDPAAFLEGMTQEWTEGLEGKPFMGGQAPSGADIAVFGIARAVADLKAGPIFKKNAAFTEWLNQMKAATELELSVV